MKSFDLYNPKTLQEAVALLAPPPSGHPALHTRILAGGQDLLTEMKDHLVEPDVLVNLKSVPGLSALAWDAAGNLSIGALARISDLEHDSGIGERCPMLGEAARSVASPQIRNAGTVGGNLCQRPRCLYYRSEHAICLKKGGTECFSYSGHNKYNAILGGGPSYIVHPSDLAPALVALDAEIELVGPAGARTLPMEKFFVPPSRGDVRSENDLRAGEIVVRVRVPTRGGNWRGTYLKFKERSSFDFALSSVALSLEIEGEAIRAARLCLGGVAPIPWRVPRAEALLVGAAHRQGGWEDVLGEALRGAEPLSQNGYKVPLTRGLIVKALRKLGVA